MKAPKCRVCGAEHYQNQPHVFKAVNNPVNQPEPVNTEVNKCCAEKDLLIEALRAEIAELTQPADRTAYMREYMRKRRATT